MVESIAIYKTVLIGALPPLIRRLPLDKPLSRLNGAKPTNALIFLLESCPSSGSSPSKV